MAEKKWSDLQEYHKECKDSVVRTGTRKVQEALLPIRDYLDKSLAEYDPTLIFKITELADLAETETEFNAVSRIANNSYWALIALAEKAPDRLKDRIARPDIENYRFILDGLENRMINVWSNYEGSGTVLDSIGQIANVDAQNMPMQINHCPAFFTTDMYSAGEALTPAEREQIAELAETEFTGPACDPDNIGNSILNYIEAHPADKGMVLRSVYGPIAIEYEKEYADARRINRTNRQVHNIVVSLKK